MNAEDGKMYERAAIERVIATTGLSPTTRAHITRADLRPNVALRAACEVLRSARARNTALHVSAKALVAERKRAAARGRLKHAQIAAGVDAFCTIFRDQQDLRSFAPLMT